MNKNQNIPGNCTNRHSADVLKKITFFLLSFLDIYSKVWNYYLNWSFRK